MPQIGWFEILIIVVVAILVIGPKDFPVVLKKIGNWIGSTKRYFGSIQDKMIKLDKTIEELEKAENIDSSLLRFLTVKVKKFDLETDYFKKNDEKISLTNFKCNGKNK